MPLRNNRKREPYYGEIPELKGVWAIGNTLEELLNVFKTLLMFLANEELLLIQP